MKKFVRTPGEIETYLTFMAASGGIAFLSDHMGLLKGHSKVYLEKVLPPSDKSAIPLDLFESAIPGIISFGVYEGMEIFALINWGDYEKEMALPEYIIKENVGSHLFDFWDDRYLGKIAEGTGNRAFTIEPHDTLVLFVTKDLGKPALIGSNLHITGGIRQSFHENDRELVIEVKRIPSFEPHVYLNAREPVKEVTGGQILESKDGVLKINLKSNYCLIKF